jgi:hypothetical protein
MIINEIQKLDFIKTLVNVVLVVLNYFQANQALSLKVNALDGF